MQDLAELRALGRELDAGVPEPSAALRRRVLAGFHASPGRGRPADARLRRNRTARRLAIGAGLVSALTAAILASPVTGVWGPGPGASADAVRVLDRAALVALRGPALAPRPSRFVFVESLTASATFTQRRPGHAAKVTIQPELREIWLSVNGTRDGLLREQPRTGTAPGHPTGPWQYTTLPGCHGRHHPRPTGAAWANGCNPTPGAPRDLPTTTTGMLRYLYQHRAGQNPPDQQAFITAGDLIRESYIPPAALAAVFRATAHIPGVTVARGAVTADGKRGIAVQRIFNGISQQLIFDPASYAFIGEREEVISATGGLRPGTIMDSTAVLRVAIVDRAGQLP
jgi:hypothetical protein